MNEYWESFFRTGKIDDYLNYIACTREEGMEDYDKLANSNEEGGYHAGTNSRDGDGIVDHAGW